MPYMYVMHTCLYTHTSHNLTIAVPRLDGTLACDNQVKSVISCSFTPLRLPQLCVHSDELEKDSGTGSAALPAGNHAQHFRKLLAGRGTASKHQGSGHIGVRWLVGFICNSTGQAL